MTIFVPDSTLVEWTSEDSARGCFARLMPLLTPIIERWMEREYQRGTSNELIALALANVCANLIGPFVNLYEGNAVPVVAKEILDLALRTYTQPESVH